jgi:transposase
MTTKNNPKTRPPQRQTAAPVKEAATAACAADWIIAIDRSDATLDICQRRRDGGEASDFQIANTPESLRAWVESWPALEPGSRRLVAFEQPCRQLLGFFHPLIMEEKIVLYALNPHTPQALRRAFTPSNDKSDVRDAAAIAEVLASHEDKITRWRWQPGSELTRRLRPLVEDRRHAVEERTALTNALKELLKATFPLALKMISGELWRTLSTDFLLKWPTLAELQSAKTDAVRRFYHAHECRRADVVEKRLALIADALPMTADPVLLEAARLKIQRLAEEIAVLTRHLARYDKAIAEIYARHPDSALFDSLPGSGPVFGPRLAAVMGEDRGQYESATSLQCRSGIAPIRRQSGKKNATVRRTACPRFERQTFHEWAGETIPKSAWAKAFYESQIAAGKLHHTALRALAFKWQRILWRCWQDGTPYDEARYEAALAAKGSPLASRIAEIKARKTPANRAETSARKM